MFWERMTDLCLIIAIVLIFSMVFVPGKNAHSIHLDNAVENTVEETVPETEATVPAVEDEVHIRKENLADEIFQNADVIPLYINVYRNPQTGNYTWGAINGFTVFDPETILETPEAQNANFLAMVMPGDGHGAPAEMAQKAAKETNATIRVLHSYPGLKAQKSYEIVMDAGRELWGNQRIFTLHKFENDGLRFRARLVDELLQDVPQLVAPNTKFVQLFVRNITGPDPRVYINHGLYTMIEHLDQKTILNHGLSDEGELYMLNNFEFGGYPTAVLETSAPSYDKAAMDEYIENRTGSDNKKLITMLDAINDTEITVDQILNRYFDRENILYWMAFQILTGNVDSRIGNSYLYSPPNSQKWFFLLNDFSDSFHRFEYERSGWKGQREWESGITNYWPNSLFQRFLKNKQFRSDLTVVVGQLAETVLSKENIYSKAAPLREIVLKYLNTTPDISKVTYPSWMYGQVYDKLADEVQRNQKLYEDSLYKPMPFSVKPPVADQGQLYLDWEPAYDLDGSDVRYEVQLSANPQFYEPLETQVDIRLPSARLRLPSLGVYYVRIIAENSKGMKQTALDILYSQDGPLYGVKKFQVTASGEVIELAS